MGKEKTNGHIPLSALMEDVVAVELVSPSGRRTKLHMRSLTDPELRQIRRLYPEPKPPMGDYFRNPRTGVPEQRPRLDDPTYLVEMEEVAQRRALASILRSTVDLDVPGETETQKIENLDNSLQVWAKQKLLEEFNRLNGWGQAAIEEAEREVTPFAAVSTPSSAASDGA